MTRARRGPDRPTSVRLLAICLCALLSGARAAADGDPEVSELAATLVLESDRWTRVSYRLEFVERTPRDRLARWGPFENGFEVLNARAGCDGEPVGVRLVPLDHNCLAVRFRSPTREGSRYVLDLEYRFPSWPILPDRNGVRWIDWRPTPWDLPVLRSELSAALPIWLPEALGADAGLAAEWARRQGILQVQPEPLAEGSGFHAVPDDAGRFRLAFRARYWSTPPRRAPGISLQVPTALLPEDAAPVFEGRGAGGDDGLPEEVGAEDGESGAPAFDPRWAWTAGMAGMLAALAWVVWRAGRRPQPAGRSSGRG